MDSVAVTVPLRPPTKKMKKRKELDALAPPHAVSRRSSGKRSSQELLTDSSDERSEYWNVSARSGRKCRGRRGRGCPGLLRACSAFLACASVLATASLIWLFIDVRQQLSALRTELDQVIAGSEGVPDALQKCHSLSRDLQNNQTIIFTQLSDLKLQINNFTTQVAGIQLGLHQVQEWFHAAPELAKVPKDLGALSKNVLSFGSDIQELGTAVKQLKEANKRIQEDQTTMQQNITNIKNSLLEFSNVTQKPQMSTINETKIKTDELNTAISQLTKNLTHINETLTRKTQWVSEDQKKDHDTLVGLQDTAQEVRTKLMSLQTECAKEARQVVLSETVQKLSDQVTELHVPDITDKLKELEQSYAVLKNTTNIILVAISDIQNQQQLIKSKENAGPFNFDVTTEIDRGASGTVRFTDGEEAARRVYRSHFLDANESVERKSTSKPKRLSIGQK